MAVGVSKKQEVKAGGVLDDSFRIEPSHLHFGRAHGEIVLFVWGGGDGEEEERRPGLVDRSEFSDASLRLP